MGIVAADENGADPRREAGDPLPERLEEYGVLPHAMAVVQHQQGGNRKQRGEILEIPLREHGQAGHSFRGQERKTPPLARRGLCGGQPQIVEKRGEVRIRLIDLVPETWKAPGFDVAADQGGLPASGRPRDPDQRRLAGLVQKAIQPVPWEISRRCGAGDFCKGVGGPQWTPPAQYRGTVTWVRGKDREPASRLPACRDGSAIVSREHIPKM